MMFCREYLLKIGGFPPIDVGDEFYLMKEAICGGGNFAYIQGCHVMAYILWRLMDFPVVTVN